MRRSFGRGGTGGGGGGGAAGGGGGMFRTASRVATAGMSNLQEHSSSSSSSSSTNSPRIASKLALSLSTASTAINPALFSLSNSVYGFGPTWTPSSSSSLSDDYEWVCVHDEPSIETEDDSFDGSIFGSVPSPSEAQTALLSLQQALPISSSSDSDWIEPSLQLYGYEHRLCPRIGRVYDALHMLQTDPSIQRVVISLSSDRAVWDAVLNNEAVRELRESYSKDEASPSENLDKESNPSATPTNVLSWILDNMKAKFIEFLAGITDLMKEKFQTSDHKEIVEFPDELGEKVRAAFMLTAIVLLIVVLTRAGGA